MSADPSDQATQLEEFMRNAALSFRKPELPVTGFCHNCDEKLLNAQRFCDTDCRDDYELRTGQ